MDLKQPRIRRRIVFDREENFVCLGQGAVLLPQDRLQSSVVDGTPSRFAISARTQIGNRKKICQDSGLIIPGMDHALLAVADGNNASGHAISELLLKYLFEF